MKAKILIVDDDPLITKLLEKKLSKAGFTNDSVHDGQEALEKIHQFKPDIIISDIMMPRLDGYELHRSLRQNPHTASIPFIFMSSKASPEDQLEGLRMGADEYVCKPFDFENLIERIQNVMDRSAAVNPYNGRPDFSGNLSRMKMVDILQLVEINLKTGELVFKKQNGKIEGKAFFKKGSLIDARTGNLSGQEAFFDLLEKNIGYFEFFSDSIDIPETITEPTMSVLMNGTRLIDEAQSLSKIIQDTTCRFQIITREIDSALENKIKKENLDHILELVEKNVMCHQILNSEVMSKPRAASALALLLKEKILEVQCLPKTPKFQMDSHLLQKIHDIYTQGLTGILKTNQSSLSAIIYFKKGEIIQADFGMTTGKKALFRIFSQKNWNIEFYAENVSVDRSIQDSLDKLLIDATREMEGLSFFDDSLLNQKVSMHAENSDQIKLPGNPEKLFTIFELVKTHKIIREVVEYSPYSDLETLKTILDLINHKVLAISEI
jgi:DNA-binding response OmpR family regulator